MTDKDIKETIDNTAEENNTEEVREIVFEEALEAILFAAGHPVKYASLAKVLNMTPAVLRDKVFEYSLLYNKESSLKRGVILLTFPDACQLCTKEYYLPEIRQTLGIRKSGTLSTAAMETLSLVAYNQPVTRAFIDTVRKVDSSYAMNSLVDRGLIEAVGRLDVPGRPMLFGTTPDFLRCFGMRSLEDLPPCGEELIEMFERVHEEEIEELENQISFDETNPEDMTPEGAAQPAEETSDESETASGDSSDNTDSTDNNDADGNPPTDFEEPSAEDDIIDID